MLRRKLGCSLRRRQHLTQQVSDAAKVSCCEKVDERCIEYLENLQANFRLRLLLENVEQRRRHPRAEIVRVLPTDLAMQILDLVLIEEIQRRVEVRHVDDRGRVGCRAVRRLLDLLGVDLPRLARVRNRRGWIHSQILVAIARVGEIGFPEHCEEVVFIGRCLTSPLENPKKRDDFLVLEAFEELQLANPILEAEPGEAVRALARLREYDVVVPQDFRLGERERQLIDVRPDCGESAAERVERAFIDRIVREV